MRRYSALLPLLLAMLLTTPCTYAQDDAQALQPQEQWFVLTLGGSRAGYVHSTHQQVDDTLVTTSQTHITIRRGDAEMVIDQSTRFVESLENAPISSSMSMSMGALGQSQQLDFTTTPWTLTSTTAGRENVTQIQPTDVEWMTPAALAEATEQAIARGDESFTVTTFDLSMGARPVSMTMTRQAEEDIEVFGRVVPAIRWTTETSALPGTQILQWTDSAGSPIRQKVPLMPGMEFEMLLADRQLALAEVEAPELLAASLITPDRAIDNPRRLSRGIYELSAPDLRERVGDTIPTAGHQTAEWVDADTLRITVDLSEHITSNATQRTEAHLAATSMLNHEDEAVRALTREIPDFDAENNAPAAEWIRQAARDHINQRDLSVGFASASETARTRQGDCTEHACLLAAMLRGANIPSRTVTGLVYADQFAGQRNIFGFHMWAQAWIENADGTGYWLDLDAAMPGNVNSFDATHIALGTSTMSDGEGLNAMVSLMPLMQGLEIRVIGQVQAE